MLLLRLSSLRGRLLLTPTAIACFLIVGSMPAYNQLVPVLPQQPGSESSAAPPHRRLTFDIVSIRPSRRGEPPGGFSITPDGYKQSGMPLIITLMMAYLPMTNIPMDRIKGAPSWLENDPYDVIVKVAPEYMPLWQSLNQNRTRKADLEDVLQDVLRTRMNLTIHKAPTHIDGYELVFRKRSPHLVQSGNRTSPPAGAIPIAGGGTVVPAKTRGDDQVLRFYNTSMDALAIDLTQEARGFTIENHTRLEGAYDFFLPRRTPQSSQDSDQTASSEMIYLPWDVRAIGLDIKTVQIASWNLVVDHIDRPSAN